MYLESSTSLYLGREDFSQKLLHVTYARSIAVLRLVVLSGEKVRSFKRIFRALRRSPFELARSTVGQETNRNTILPFCRHIISVLMRPPAIARSKKKKLRDNDYSAKNSDLVVNMF